MHRMAVSSVCAWEVVKHQPPTLPSPVQITADFKVGGNGSVEFKEEDGIDYAPVTVQLPGGERVAFLFTIKQLNATGTLDSFSGDFNVPSYRGSSFLDPKVGEEHES